MDNSFGAWIKRRRKALDLTQQELALRMGCSVSAIFKIESDERRPSRQIAELLVKHLEIPPDQQTLFLKVARREKAVDTLAELPILDQPLSQPTQHLPHILHPLIGREFELAEILRLIQDPQCRLVTLTGQGGVGKTRLALQAASALEDSFDNGVFFISFIPVAGREQCVTMIADAIGIVLYSATDRSDQLLAYLYSKQMLLVIDNFEHLAADPGCSSLVADILQSAHEVQIIITSRQPLHLQAEWVFAVQGLPVPKSDQPGDLKTNGAVELFIQRARQSNARFEPSHVDQIAIARICELVEGLPLGLELAAAWVGTLSCTEIADEIQRSVNFLETIVHDVPERHRSIRVTVEHSWKLLSNEEQRVLRQLSVFRGGFTRQAAEAVAHALLSVLSSLVSKSLLHRTKSGRYEMHEIIHQFAWERLQENEEECSQTQISYCQYFAELLAIRGASLKGSDRSATVSELVADIGNLRQTWHWAAANKNFREISQAADTMFWLYESRSNCREGVPLFGEAVNSFQQSTALSGDADWSRQLALGKALGYQGFFLFRQGRHPEGRDALKSSFNILENIAQSDSNEVRMAFSNTSIFLGTVTSVMGDFAGGDRILHEGLNMKTGLNDPWGSAFCLRQMGLSAQYQGDYASAYKSLEQSLAISRQIGNEWSISASLNHLGLVSHAQEKYDQAHQYLSAGLELSRALEDRASIAFALDGLGLVSMAQGRYAEAQALLDESIALWTEIGEQGSLAQTLNHQGDTWLMIGNVPEARKCFSEALKVASFAQITPVLMDSLIGEAALQIQEGRLESALELLTIVGKNFSGSQLARDRAEQLRIETEARLPEEHRKEIRSKVESKDVSVVVREILQSI
jgi:predicted ATPase/DNA-binding XRE family transcriptional regulator